MNAFEFNKIAGACLAALLAIFGTRTLVHELRDDKQPQKAAYVVEGASGDATPSLTGSEASAGGTPDVATLLAGADVGAGEKLFKKCRACHTREAGKGHRVGPNLFGVAERDIASSDGFAFSTALKSKDGNWTADALNSFLTSPKAYAKGNKMSFAGLKKPEQRANMIKYLQSLK